MKKWFWLLATWISSLALVVPAASAAREFSVSDIRGPYGFFWSGSVSAAPAVSVGQAVSDGRGSFNGERFVNLGGTVVQQTFTCTLTVNPNGIGTSSCAVS